MIDKTAFQLPRDKMKSEQRNLLRETIRGNTNSAWIDKNGHVNISHYLKLLDNSLEVLCSFPGSINSILEISNSYVARSYCVKHQIELMHPSSWYIKAGITSITTKKFVSYHCLYKDQTRIAKFSIESVFFDLISRKAIEIGLNQINSYTYGLVKGFDQMIIK